MNSVITHKCSRCGIDKSLDNFYPDKRTRKGVGSYCKSCHNEWSNEYRRNRRKVDKDYRESQRVKQLKRYHENKNRYRAYRKEYCEYKLAENPNWKRLSEVARKVKRTFEEVEKWFNHQWLIQQAQCSICGKVFCGDDCIDHDHNTLELRGLLCFSCNLFIGGAKDNTSILYNAIKYLERK